MAINQLRQRLAHLESVNDQLATELSYVDTLMRKLGFSDGIETVKASAEELMEEEVKEERAIPPPSGYEL